MSKINTRIYVAKMEFLYGDKYEEEILGIYFTEEDATKRILRNIDFHTYSDTPPRTKPYHHVYGYDEVTYFIEEWGIGRAGLLCIIDRGEWRFRKDDHKPALFRNFVEAMKHYFNKEEK